MAGADFWSMKGSYFAIERGQLFCLLGPNGAGACKILRDALAGILLDPCLARCVIVNGDQ